MVNFTDFCKVIKKFSFADPKNDVKDIENKIITKVIFVSEEDIKTMLYNAGAFDSKNKVQNREIGERYDYIKEEGVGGGKLDFSYTEIPNVYPDASKNPLTTPSSIIFVVDEVAYNHMNFGNFLFGAAGKAMRFFIGELTLGAHYNSLNLNRDGGNGYEPQLDSEDDQNSIENGYIHARDNNYEDIEYKVEIGPLEYDFGIE